MIELTIEVPQNKLGELDTSDQTKVSHYGIDAAPRKYVSAEPDFANVADVLRQAIKQSFITKAIAVRLVSLYEHNLVNNTDITVSQLVDIIKQHGSDRYNPAVDGDRYDNLEGRHIDFFAMDSEELDNEIFRYSFSTFYYYGIAKYAHPRLVDVIIIYDTAKLKQVEYTNEQNEDTKSDGYRFADTSDKSGAVLGIITIKA